MAILALSAGMAGFFVSFLMAEQYKATALVLVRPQEKLSLSDSDDKKELLNFPVMAGGQSSVDAMINTYVGIIESRVMAVKVVEKLGLDKVSGPPETESEGVLGALKDGLKYLAQQAAGALVSFKDFLVYGRALEPATPYEEAIAAYSNNISLETIQDTHLFKVTYADKDPRLATDVANTTAELLVAHAAEMNMGEETNALRFLGDQLDEAEAQLYAAMERQRRFKVDNNTVAFEDENSELIRLIADLESELEKVKAELSGLAVAPGFKSGTIPVLEAERDYYQQALIERRKELTERTSLEALLTAHRVDVGTAKDSYELLKAEYEEARILQGKDISELLVVSLATVPGAPSKPIRVLFGAAAAFLAFMIGLYAVGFREAIRPTIRNVEDVERALDLRVLAAIPKTNRMLAGYR